VPAIIDPSFGSQQCVCDSLRVKGLPSLDDLAGRVHLDYEHRGFSSAVAGRGELGQGVCAPVLADKGCIELGKIHGLGSIEGILIARPQFPK